MRTVFFQGTFDILNAGHVRAFKIARAKGDRLIVGLNSDSLVRWFKLREPILPFRQRREILQSIKWIDQVVECNEPHAIRYVTVFNVDVYVLTEEWEGQQREAIEYMREKGGTVYFSPRYEDIFDSSTIRARVVTINLGKEGTERDSE